MLDVSTIKIQQDEPMNICNYSNNNSNNNPMPVFTTYNNWVYTMRRSMQEIIPGLYLGPFSSAQKHCLKTLLENGITHIVCVRQQLEAHFIKPQFTDLHIKYLILDIADNATENIIRYFPKVRQFIDEAFAGDGKVLVHGNNGISRSATLVLAYIMEKFGLTCNDAMDYVRKRRACVHPNDGFLNQLFEYEPIYRARQTLERGECSIENRHFKRKSEQLYETYDCDLIQPPPSPISDNNNNNNNHCQLTNDFSNHLYKLWLLKGN